MLEKWIGIVISVIQTRVCYGAGSICGHFGGSEGSQV